MDMEAARLFDREAWSGSLRTASPDASIFEHSQIKDRHSRSIVAAIRCDAYHSDRGNTYCGFNVRWATDLSD
jgi:hypothetical protein